MLFLSLFRLNTLPPILGFNCLLMQKNLKYKWSYNSSTDNLIELPSNTNDPDLHYNMQHEHQPQHIDTVSSYKTKNNYNSIELQPRSNQYTYSKKYQQQGQQQINYPNSVVQSYDTPHVGNHHHNNNQGVYFYKIENFTSFGTISCSAENQYGSSGPCLYHIMVAGELFSKGCENVIIIADALKSPLTSTKKGYPITKIQINPMIICLTCPNINLNALIRPDGSFLHKQKSQMCCQTNDF